MRDQIELIRLRNRSPAFEGEIEILDSEPHVMHIRWRHPQATATLKADLRKHGFSISESKGSEPARVTFEAAGNGSGPTYDSALHGVSP